MFSDSGILIVGRVQEFDYLILIYKCAIMSHTVEFMIKFGLGFEYSTIDYPKAYQDLKMFLSGLK